MDEVDALVAHGHAKMIETVELGLPLPPVIGVQPVIDELLHIGDRRAGFPTGALRCAWPARPLKPPLQIFEDGVLDVNRKRLDF